MNRTPLPRHVAAAMGLAGWCWLPAWDAVLSLPATARDWPPVAWVTAATVLLVALMVGVRWLPSRWRLAGAILVCVPVGWLSLETGAFLYHDAKNSLAVLAGEHYAGIRNAIGVALLLLVAGLSLWVWRHGLRLAIVRAAGLLALLAALPVVLLGSYFLPAPAGMSTVSDAPARRSTVVLVLDELDDNAIAADASALPHFASMRAVALSATRMYPPANYTTESLPGMLTGEVFADASYSRRDVHLRLPGRPQWVSLATQGQLLGDALLRGERVSIIGWHLPYCTLWGRRADCWDDAAFSAPGRSVSLPVWLMGHSRLVAAFESHRLQRLVGDLEAYSRGFLASAAQYRLHRIGEIFALQRRRLIDHVVAERHELVFAHLACPHPPSQNPMEVRRLDIFAAYAANLRRCDQALGDVMAALARSRRPEGWTLIVTSDHWFRGRDWRDAGRPLTVPTTRRTVPFFITGRDWPTGQMPTDRITNSRVLRRLVEAASAPGFTVEDARRLIEAQGDSTTVMRPF